MVTNIYAVVFTLIKFLSHNSVIARVLDLRHVFLK